MRVSSWKARPHGRLGALRGRSYVPLVLGAIALASAPLWGGGCQNVEKVEIPNVFRTTPERPLADVPVPVGFRYVERGSFIFDSNFRVAKLRYSGSQRLDEVVAFYTEQMPRSQWSFIGKSGEGEDKVLEFQSEMETCVVTLDREGGQSTLEIEIAPRRT